MKKYQNFLSENFHFLVVKFSVYLNKLSFFMGIGCVCVCVCVGGGGGGEESN